MKLMYMIFTIRELTEELKITGENIFIFNLTECFLTFLSIHELIIRLKS